jgi:superfamily II DNA or RNA helicase
MSDIIANSSRLTSQGYTIPKSVLTLDVEEDIKNELTIIPQSIPGYTSNSSADDGRFHLYKHSTSKYYLPRNYGIKKFGIPGKNKINDGLSINCPFAGELRDYQKAVISAWKESTTKCGGGGIVAIRPGGGKTVISIGLIAELGVKTIILVHNSDLLNQWIERLEMFLPTARIGKIKAKICNTSEKDVVIGSIQSISDPRKDAEYDPEMFKEFGLLIVDECHHIGAKSFSRCLDKIQPKYVLGLSATPHRQDGLTRVIKYYLGDICFDDTQIEKTELEKSLEHIPDAEVQLYKYKCDEPDYCRILLNYQKKPNNAGMITNIMNYEPRNEFILSLLPDLVAQNRNILLITERRDHVAYFLEKIMERNIASCGPYVGSTKQEILAESKKKQILIGTYQMTGEGFDCAKLDTLVLATPKKSLRQIAGRIMRKEKHKRERAPLIIDIIDDFSIYKNWARLRQAFYNYSNYIQYEYAVYGEDDNRVEHIKNHDWPVPMKKRPKTLPDLKADVAIEKMIKIEKAEERKKKTAKPKKVFNLLNMA